MEKQIDNKVEVFSQLFRELEADIGTRDMAILVFMALEKSISSFKPANAKDFCTQFKSLLEMVSNTEPKFGVLNYNFANLMRSFNERISEEKFSQKKWKMIAVKQIQKILKSNKSHRKDLIHFAEDIDVEGKTILIHDHSHTVQDVLAHYKHMGKHFKVVIAEQDFEKTHSNIERMHGSGISFQVVPAYMLSHVHDQIDMAFFGGVTIKNTMHIVMDPGTYGTISELAVDNIPSYMFIDTNKFSLWKSKHRGGIFIHRHKRMHYSKPIEYERIKYSHDRVPVKLFSKIVTNKGVFTPTEIKGMFEKKMSGAKWQ